MKAELDYIQDLQLKSFISGMKAESGALWLLCLYILVEYLRPQNMYSVIDFLPWGQVFVVACFVSVFTTNSKIGSYGAMDKIFVALTALVILSVLFAYDSAVSMKYWTTLHVMDINVFLYGVDSNHSQQAVPICNFLCTHKF